CHGSRHPPEGFSFPKNFAPPLVGSNAMTDLTNAQQLYDFASARMPYQAPASLTHEEYWQLVAFIFRPRRALLARVDQSKPHNISLLLSPLPVFDYSVLRGTCGIIFLGLVTGITVWKVKRRKN